MNKKNSRNAKNRLKKCWKRFIEKLKDNILMNHADLNGEVLLTI